MNYHIQAAFCLLLLFSVLLFSVSVGDWGHVVITGGFLFITVALTLLNKLPRLFFILIPLTVFIYILGSEFVLDLYDRVSWYDNLTHFFTEFVLTLLAGCLLQSQVPFLKRKATVFTVLVGIGILFGVLWEIIEWQMTYILHPGMLVTWDDTVSDLFFDTLGVVLAAFLISKPKVIKALSNME